MTTKLPIACALTTSAFAARQQELRAGVLAAAESVERVPDGWRWTFRGSDVLARIGAVLDAERHCCRFLRFSVAAEPDLGVVTLEISGTPGTAAFLESWLAPAAR